jgi:hypothetical protein
MEPAPYNGVERRKQGLTPEQRLEYDASNLIRIAQIKLGKDNVSPEEVLSFRTRPGEQSDEIARTTAILLKGKEPILQQTNETADAVQVAVAVTQSELSTELKKGLDQIKHDFNRKPDLHRGIEWIDVEKSLRADQATLERLIQDNAKGHAMNVFALEGGHYTFVTAQLDARKMDISHRNVMFDAQANKDNPSQDGENCNGNATDIAVTQMGAELADEYYHQQLRKLYGDRIKGWFYLKTDEQASKSTISCARYGRNNGVFYILANFHNINGSFRIMRKLKKV